MDQQTVNGPFKKISWIGAAGIVVIAAIVLLVGRKSVDFDSVLGADDDDVDADDVVEQVPAAAEDTQAAKPEAASTATSTFTYKDGTYTASGVYMAPSGQEQVGVEVTLKDGIVTAVSLQNQAVNPTSKQFQTMCGMNVSMMVVGKSIDEIALTKISGSSLTPKGFNDALEKIKAEAKG